MRRRLEGGVWTRWRKEGGTLPAREELRGFVAPVAPGRLW